MKEPLPELIVNETALLVIDMQNSFCHPKGSIGAAGIDVSDMTATIDPVKRLIEACRSRGILDIWTIQEHYPDDVQRFKHRIKPHTLRLSSGPPALVNTWHSEIVEELKELAQAPAELVRKHRFSGFLDTRLETLLRMKGIRTLIVCGVSSTLCVETTVRDAYQRDYDVIVVDDAVATSDRDMHLKSMAAIAKWFGVVCSTEEVLNYISS